MIINIKNNNYYRYTADITFKQFSDDVSHFGFTVL